MTTDRIRRRRALATWTLSGALVFLLGWGCADQGEGVAPPGNRIYFPVGLEIDEDSRHLFVIGSDFDLQFNQGVLQSLSLERVRALARVPCSSNSDCASGQRCDVTPTEQNGGVPSWFCVDSSGPWADLPCGPLQENAATERRMSPGRCAPVPLDEPFEGASSLIVDAATISAFATGARLVSSPLDASLSRLFIPVRGDSSLHWTEVRDGLFQCGQEESTASAGSPPRCADDHRVTLAPGWIEDLQPKPVEGDLTPPLPPLRVAPEPFDLAATADGRVLVLSHQTGGAVSAFANDWIGPPVLVDRLGGSTDPAAPPPSTTTGPLPANPMGIAVVPPASPDQPWPSGDPAFLLTSRSEPTVVTLRFMGDGILGAAADDPAASARLNEDSRPELLPVGPTPLRTNATGIDSRGVAIDGEKRRRALGECSPEDAACLDAAANVPLDVYIANRTPASLIIGSIDPVPGPSGRAAPPAFFDTIPLSVGASRVILGDIVNPAGVRERRVFVLCFDSSLIYVYDPKMRAIEAEIATGRGPHALAFDSEKPIAYVAHFTDSYVGVFSLDQRHPRTYGAFLASLGEPTPPRASK